MRRLTTALLVILGGGSPLLAEQLLLPSISDSSSRFDTSTPYIATGRSIDDRSFLSGPLKNLAWNVYGYSAAPTVESHLVKMPNFEMRLVGEQRLGRYERIGQLPSGLGPWEDSYELGLFTRNRYGDYLFGTRLRKNVAPGHNAVLGEFMAGYARKLSEKLDLSLGVGTAWADGNDMPGAYHMSSAQTLSAGSLLSTPSSAFKNASLTVSACYQLSDYWSLGAQVGYMRLLERAAASSPTLHDHESENFVTGIQLQYRLRALAGAKFRDLLRPACQDY